MPDLAIHFATLLPESPGPYVALVLIGFVAGGAGHLFASRLLIVIGICLIFLGAFLFPVAYDLTGGTPPRVDGQR